MRKCTATLLVDLGLLLTLLALSFAIWYLPCAALVILGLVVLCGCFVRQ